MPWSTADIILFLFSFIPKAEAMVLSPQSYHLYMLKEDCFYFTNTLLTLQQNTNKTLLVKKWWLKYHFVSIIFKVYWYNIGCNIFYYLHFFLRHKSLWVLPNQTCGATHCVDPPNKGAAEGSFILQYLSYDRYICTLYTERKKGFFLTVSFLNNTKQP